MEFHFEILFPQFLSILRVEAGKYSGCVDREDKLSVGDRAADVRHIVLDRPHDMRLGI